MSHFTPLTTHPGWCSTLCCESTPSDVCHRSAVTRLPLPDATWEFQAVVTDERAFPGQPLEPELSVSLTNTAMVGQEGYAYLTPEHLHALIQMLTEQYWRLVHLTVPVVRHIQGRMA